MRNIELKEEVKCKGEETEALYENTRLIGTYSIGTTCMMVVDCMVVD